MFWGVVRVVAVLSLAMPVMPAAASSPTDVRILIVGDSVSQGSTGDWTWRYRLWQHLRAGGVAVDFVGPRTDLFDIRSRTFGWTEYADPAFDVDHAAVWGAALNSYPYSVTELVATYRPDAVLLVMGVNDLVGQGRPAADVAASLREYVQQAQTTAPGVDVIVAEMPWLWYPGVAQTNELLREMASSLDSPEARVISAGVEPFTEDLDTFDRVHLTAAGETKIAAAMADALATLSVGAPYPRPLPPVPNVPVGPATLQATAQEQQVTMQWSRPTGAMWYQVEQRDVTGAGSWVVFPQVILQERWTLSGLRSDHLYEFRVRAGKGTVFSDQVSNVVTVKPKPPVLRGVPKRHGASVSWNPVVGAGSYVVRWAGGRQRTTGTAVNLRGLRAGRPYVVTVTPRPASKPVLTVSVTPSGPRPVAPKGLRVKGTAVHWRPVPDATRYRIRKLSERRWTHLGWTHRTQYPAAPGRYRVQSWHQDLPGAWAVVKVR